MTEKPIYAWVQLDPATPHLRYIIWWQTDYSGACALVYYANTRQIVDPIRIVNPEQLQRILEAVPADLILVMQIAEYRKRLPGFYAELLASRIPFHPVFA